MEEVLAALRGQLDELDGLLEPLDEDGWSSPSACEGWSIGDVVLHLAQTNEMAAASARGSLADASGSWDRVETETVDDVAAAAVEAERGATGAEIHERWRASADDMVAALGACEPNARVLWAVGELAARTLATTRLAETWIHTQDVAEGLGVDLPGSDRLWHVTRLVHRTIPYSFARAGEDPPDAVRFSLTAPDSDDTWDFGDDDAATVITGPALDLCRVAGQRTTAADTDLSGEGPAADRVLALVRTFA